MSVLRLHRFVRSCLVAQRLPMIQSAQDVAISVRSRCIRRESCPNRAAKHPPKNPGSGLAASAWSCDAGFPWLLSPWRRKTSVIFARSGGPPAAAPITWTASRKYAGPIIGFVSRSPKWATTERRDFDDSRRYPGVFAAV